jgi:hypothetical protein
VDGGSGRCLCGAVRYGFDGAPNWQSHCHCESCRRATASGFTSYLAVNRDRLRWTGTLARYTSSPGVIRSFCPVCGTQMAFETDRRPHETDLFAATLDDPASFRPTLHDYWNERLPWIHVADGLPRVYTPRRLSPGEDTRPLLALIRDSFADMEGRISPPSSVRRLTDPDIALQAVEGEVWLLEDLGQSVACMFLTPRPDSLYLGKLAVAATHRRQGLARQLVVQAEVRARARGLPVLELQTRVELEENHAAFRAMGFAEAGRTAHPGYDRPTSITFRKDLPP